MVLLTHDSLGLQEGRRRVLVPGVPRSRIEFRLAVHPPPQASLHSFPPGGENELVMSFLCCSVTQLCPTLYDSWTAAHQTSLSVTMSQSLLKFTSIESVMPSNHLILYRPLLFLPSVLPSIRVFSNESALRIR